jgi:LmbE family N-acetylglucosaminyl deacetylase
MDIKKKISHSSCVIVAHPDDETLWTGGTILLYPHRKWEVYTACRASDPDRAPKFYRALSQLGATGGMADLDDGPEQTPLLEEDVRQTILDLIDQRHFDFLVTHGPSGEYTRHRRHEEVSRNVLTLWDEGKIHADEVWFFAYTDSDGRFFPHAEKTAHIKTKLPAAVWQKKYRIITEVYGFPPDSWEARTTPKMEAFWTFLSPKDAKEWIQRKETG